MDEEVETPSLPSSVTHAVVRPPHPWALAGPVPPSAHVHPHRRRVPVSFGGTVWSVGGSRTYSLALTPHSTIADWETTTVIISMT